MDQEVIMRAQMIEQEARQVEQNIELVNQQIEELIAFKAALNDFNDSKSKEMLSSLGKGVYVKAKALDDNLLVGVGSGIFIKKTPNEALTIIEEQTIRLNEVKLQLLSKAEEYSNAFRDLLMKIQNSDNSEKED